MRKAEVRIILRVATSVVGERGGLVDGVGVERAAFSAAAIPDWRAEDMSVVRERGNEREAKRGNARRNRCVRRSRIKRGKRGEREVEERNIEVKRGEEVRRKIKSMVSL